MPSEIPRLYWRVTHEDIKLRIKLYLGEVQAKLLQQFQQFAHVASMALGGGGKKEEFDPAQVPKTKDEALAAFANVFGSNHG